MSPAETAERLGFCYTPVADRALRDRFRDLSEIPRNAKIRHVLQGVLDGRGLAILEASYMVYAGHTMMQVSNTVYAADAPAWPSTLLSPRGLFGRLAFRMGRASGLMLESQEFNARFVVKTDEDDFAIALLSPEMQAFMLTKTRVRWRIGGGRVCLIYEGGLKAGRIEASLHRMRTFWSLVPPELHEW